MRYLFYILLLIWIFEDKRPNLYLRNFSKFFIEFNLYFFINEKINFFKRSYTTWIIQIFPLYMQVIIEIHSSSWVLVDQKKKVVAWYPSVISHHYHLLTDTMYDSHYYFFVQSTIHIIKGTINSPTPTLGSLFKFN